MSDDHATDVPDELRARLDEQDSETLRAVLSYVRESLDRELPLADDRSDLRAGNTADPDEFNDRAAEFVDEHLGAGRQVWVQKWMRNCADGCSSCPHGPYLVGIWFEDGRKHRQWLGPVDA